MDFIELFSKSYLLSNLKDFCSFYQFGDFGMRKIILALFESIKNYVFLLYITSVWIILLKPGTSPEVSEFKRRSLLKKTRCLANKAIATETIHLAVARCIVIIILLLVSVHKVKAWEIHCGKRSEGFGAAFYLL